MNFLQAFNFTPQRLAYLTFNVPGITYKIVTVGDVRVGKTTLRLRYIGSGFQEKYIPTLGIDFAVATYGKYILQIWDLAGQETFQSIVKTMYTGSAGLIVVFDITNWKSLENIPKWIDSFLEIESKDVPIVVFGNKIDLRTPETIQKSEALDFVKSLSQKYGLSIGYVETSALTGENLRSAFEDFVDQIAAKQRNN